jgi:hypothetical protein
MLLFLKQEHFMLPFLPSGTFYIAILTNRNILLLFLPTRTFFFAIPMNRNIFVAILTNGNILSFYKMSGAIHSLPQYAFMAWCSFKKKSTETAFTLLHFTLHYIFVLHSIHIYTRKDLRLLNRCSWLKFRIFESVYKLTTFKISALIFYPMSKLRVAAILILAP